MFSPKVSNSIPIGSYSWGPHSAREKRLCMGGDAGISVRCVQISSGHPALPKKKKERATNGDQLIIDLNKHNHEFEVQIHCT